MTTLHSDLGVGSKHAPKFENRSWGIKEYTRRVLVECRLWGVGDYQIDEFDIEEAHKANLEPCSFARREFRRRSELLLSRIARAAMPLKESIA